ncbi:unnamed protein product [Effrenium voratum]|nr:unnamed protein product [Effrenium voratum]
MPAPPKQRGNPTWRRAIQLKEDHSITGKFDPTALERGAKALRDLDTSPNATKAFELTKLAEQTKQKELQLEIEQQQSVRTQAAMQRNKMDADEKRKTISHQQEQERRTAEYKARLDSELYQSKLEDQQKQIDQQLQMQRLMASGLSDEQLKLAKWRLEHGETVQGRPFYDDPKFAKFCEIANEAEKKSKAGEAGKLFGRLLTPEVVEELHAAFIWAEDRARATVEELF